MVCDWIQYRSSFREVADYRPVLAPGAAAPRPRTRPTTAIQNAPPAPRPRSRWRSTCAAAATRTCGPWSAGLLDEHAHPGGSTRVPLGPWVAGRQSCIWRFNALYWQALSLWEQATGRDYEQALPGGESDARNTAAVRELILELFKTWDDLDARSALPRRALRASSSGSATATRRRTWLDEFVKLSRAHSRDYYRRLHYIMGDYSPHVLGRATKAVAHHSDHISALVVDATHPAVSLGFLRGKAFLVYISNVYDNLPSDEVARIGGRTYQVETRAYLPGDDAPRIARAFSATRRAGSRAGRQAAPAGPRAAVRGAAAELRRRRAGGDVLARSVGRAAAAGTLPSAGGARPIPGHPDLTGELLRSQLESHGDIRVHVNNGALSSFAETLPLLHPFGRLQCHDLFLDDVRRYHTGFFGPGKYDGSVVNWVNGPLLRHIGGRAGFDVRSRRSRRGRRRTSRR